MRFIHSMVATVFREIYPLLRDLSIAERFIHSLAGTLREVYPFLRAGGGAFCEVYPFPGRDVS